MQGELADLGQQRLPLGLELLGEIARMTAQSLGALGDEVVVASLRSLSGQPAAGCLTSFGSTARPRRESARAVEQPPQRWSCLGGCR